MNFRIEQKESFQIMGLSGYITDDEMKPGRILPRLWDKFLNGDNNYNKYFWNNGDSYYTAPFWQIGAYDFKSEDGKTKTIIGAEYRNKKPDGVELTVETIPAATWAVFSINSTTGKEQYDAAYARILTEWLPASRHKRNEAVPSLDVYPPGKIDENYIWEIWLPVINK